ncbi:hypothetical protein RSAG8_08979, partial [Rhizoctonia solani AG-8 WAC10335]
MSIFSYSHYMNICNEYFLQRYLIYGYPKQQLTFDLFLGSDITRHCYDKFRKIDRSFRCVMVLQFSVFMLNKHGL